MESTTEQLLALKGRNLHCFVHLIEKYIQEIYLFVILILCGTFYRLLNYLVWAEIIECQILADGRISIWSFILTTTHDIMIQEVMRLKIKFDSF